MPYNYLFNEWTSYSFVWNVVSPHLPQTKRFCVMSFLTSSSTFPLLTSVQSHCLLKTPSCSCLRTFALAVKRPLSPILSSAGSSSSRSQLECHLLRQAIPDHTAKQPHSAFSMLFDFLYKSTSECPCAFIYVYCSSTQEVISTRVSPFLFMFTAVPQGPGQSLAHTRCQ